MTDPIERLAEIKARVSTHEYNAELMLRQTIDIATELAGEVERLRDALKHYAKKSHWRRSKRGWLNVFDVDTNGPAVAAMTLAALTPQEDKP